MIERHVTFGVALFMIGLVLANLSLPPVACPKPVTTTQQQKTLSEYFTVHPGSYSFRTIYLDSGDILRFSSFAAYDFSFFIADEENFKAWASGKSAQLYYQRDGTSSISGDFSAPHSGKWYLVWRNTHTPQVSTGFITITFTPPDVRIDVTATVLKTTTTYEERYCVNPNLPTIHIIGQILLVVGVTEFVYGLVAKKDKNVPARPQQ